MDSPKEKPMPRYEDMITAARNPETDPFELAALWYETTKWHFVLSGNQMGALYRAIALNPNLAPQFASHIAGWPGHGKLLLENAAFPLWVLENLDGFTYAGMAFILMRACELKSPLVPSLAIIVLPQIAGRDLEEKAHDDRGADRIRAELNEKLLAYYADTRHAGLLELLARYEITITEARP